MSLRDLWAAWDKFWFEQGSPLPVAAFRIVLGLLALRFCWWIKPEFLTFFGQHAVASPTASLLWTGLHKLNMLALLPADDRWLIAAVTLLEIAAFSLTIGLFSRASALVVYLLLVSLDARDPFALHDGIRVMYIMAFLLCFSRCGEALSLDRLVRARLSGRPVPEEPAAGSVVAQRLMQVQLSIIYWSAFACKLHNSDWIHGNTVYLVTHWVNAVRFPVPYLFDHLWTARLLTWGTLLVEFSLCTLIWVKEIRYPVLLMGVAFHLGLEWAFVIPLFQPIMVASYINFVEADDLTRTVNWIKQAVGRAFGRAVQAVYRQE